MTYNVPLSLGAVTAGPTEIAIGAAVLIVVAAMLIGMRRETAIIAGVVSALAMWVSQTT